MNHNQKILKLKEYYEKRGFNCSREHKLWRKDLGRFSKIDVCCFHKTERPRCFEVESNKQVLSNQKDLMEAKRIFGANTCQLNKDDSLKNCFRRR